MAAAEPEWAFLSSWDWRGVCVVLSRCAEEVQSKFPSLETLEELLISGLKQRMN